MFKFFKKKIKKINDNLDTALKQGLITEEELLRLRLDRAENIYKKFLKNQEKK